MTNGHPHAGLPKEERLKGKKSIEELFKNGSSFYLEPLLMKYAPSADPQQFRVLFSASKRNYKSAVKRNLIKRRMREAYRLNKSILNQNEATASYHIAFVYVGKTILPFAELEDKLKSLLRRFHKTKL